MNVPAASSRRAPSPSPVASCRPGRTPPPRPPTRCPSRPTRDPPPPWACTPPAPTTPLRPLWVSTPLPAAASRPSECSTAPPTACLPSPCCPHPWIGATRTSTPWPALPTAWRATVRCMTWGTVRMWIPWRPSRPDPSTTAPRSHPRSLRTRSLPTPTRPPSQLLQPARTSTHRETVRRRTDTSGWCESLRPALLVFLYLSLLSEPFFCLLLFVVASRALCPFFLCLYYSVCTSPCRCSISVSFSFYNSLYDRTVNNRLWTLN